MCWVQFRLQFCKFTEFVLSIHAHNFENVISNLLKMLWLFVVGLGHYFILFSSFVFKNECEKCLNFFGFFYLLNVTKLCECMQSNQNCSCSPTKTNKITKQIANGKICEIFNGTV